MKRGKRERIAKRFGTTRLRPWGLLAVTCWLIGLIGWASPAVSPATAAAPDGLRLGVFAVDASPAIGTPLAYDTCIEVLDPLSCRACGAPLPPHVGLGWGTEREGGTERMVPGACHVR